VLDRLRALFACEREVSDVIAPLDLAAPMQRAVLDRCAKLAKRWTTLASLELHALVKSLVERVEAGDAEISIRLNRTAIVSNLMPEAVAKQLECKSAAEPAALSIAASLRRAGKGTRLRIGDGSTNQINDGLASRSRARSRHATCSLPVMTTVSRPWRLGSE
jgi:hypothetical protein